MPPENDNREEELEWLLKEFELTAERAKEKGIGPAKFLIGLQRYGQRLMEDYGDTIENAE